MLLFIFLTFHTLMLLDLTNHYEVIVIGSGPSGGRAAQVLAQNNIRTAILEKSRLPRKKVCAGGITLRGLKFLPEGLESIFEQECLAVNLSIHDIPRTFSSRHTKPLISVFQRSRLDFALVTKAIEAGAYLFDQTCVQQLKLHSNYVEVFTNRGLFAAKYIVLADGAFSALAKSIGWPDHRKLAPAIEMEIKSATNVSGITN